jgi:hypothetical protein
MKTHIGRLSINKDQTIDFEAITGDLDIDSDVQLIAPNLSSVGGLYILSNAQLIAPKLSNVRKYVDIHSNAHLTAPNLSSVGDLYIDSDARLTAPNLKTITDNLFIYPNAQLTAPQLCPLKLKEGDFFRLNGTYKFIEYTREGMLALNVSHSETIKFNHQYYSKILTDKEIAEVIAEKMVGQ